MGKTKSKIIQYRVTEDTYNKIKEQAEMQNKKVNKLAEERLMASVKSSKKLTPDIVYTIKGIYDIYTSVSADKWTDEMCEKIEKGVKYLYDVLRECE